MPTQVHILSFEGPDAYARAGGIATRICGLTAALAAQSLAPHLWFVGDPDAPGHEAVGGAHYHRWCQWLGRVHPAGVYDGEHAKAHDYATSLPPWLLAHELGDHLRAGGRAVVLAEEWHTVLLVARGGMEAYGEEVLAAARARGLRVVNQWAGAGAAGLRDAFHRLGEVDIVNLQTSLDAAGRSALFRASDVVLANSAHEPFGLVGLEAMAAGGVACTGATGEDYAIAGRNAIVVQTCDPREFAGHFERVVRTPALGEHLRTEGRATARLYDWPAIVQRNLMPQVELALAQVRS